MQASSPEQLLVTMRQAIQVVFGEWTALIMALENEWGGNASRDKALALLHRVEEGMCSAQQVHADELEDLLDLALIDDFNIEAEDESPKQIAEVLARVHYEFRMGSDETAKMLINRAAAKGVRTWLQGAIPVRKQVSSDEEDLSDAEATQGGENSAMETEGNYGGSSRMPVVDEDGFQLVGKGSRGRKGL